MRMMMLCLLLLALLLLAPLSHADMPVVRVNGVAIGVLRLERYFSEYLQAQGRAVTSIRNPQLYQRLRDQALDELIDKELLWQESRRMGIVVSDAQVAAQVAEVEAAFGNPALFERRLEEAGFDRAAFADYTRHELGAQQAYARLTEVAPPGDDEVQAFYQANRQRLAEKPSQSDNGSISLQSAQALARDLLMAHKQAQARQSARQRLRQSATVERID